MCENRRYHLEGEEHIHVFIHLIHRPISICYMQKMQRWKDKVPLTLKRLEGKGGEMFKQSEYNVIIGIVEECSKCNQNVRGRNVHTGPMMSEEISQRS